MVQLQELDPQWGHRNGAVSNRHRRIVGPDAVKSIRQFASSAWSHVRHLTLAAYQFLRQCLCNLCNLVRILTIER
jgi:hypothetical protein